MGALFSTFPFNLFFKQILSLKEQKQSVPRLGVGCPSVCSGVSRGSWRGQPSILSGINDWLPQWASWVFARLLALFQDIHAAGDLAGHLIGKPRVAGLSFAEFQPRVPIWIMYSFRSQGWALNKAYSCLHINFPRMARRERKKNPELRCFLQQHLHVGFSGGDVRAACAVSWFINRSTRQAGEKVGCES